MVTEAMGTKNLPALVKFGYVSSYLIEQKKNFLIFLFFK